MGTTKTNKAQQEATSQDTGQPLQVDLAGVAASTGASESLSLQEMRRRAVDRLAFAQRYFRSIFGHLVFESHSPLRPDEDEPLRARRAANVVEALLAALVSEDEGDLAGLEKAAVALQRAMKERRERQSDTWMVDLDRFVGSGEPWMHPIRTETDRDELVGALQSTLAYNLQRGELTGGEAVADWFQMSDMVGRRVGS